MSDLQCAARIFLIDQASLADVDALAARLERERPYGLYAAAGRLAHSAPVTALSEALGLPVTTLSGTASFGPGSSAFEEIADRHRGEAVVVVTSGGVPGIELWLVDADGQVIMPMDEPDGQGDGADVASGAGDTGDAGDAGNTAAPERRNR